MSQERVLIVDDEKNIVSSLKEILSDEGYEVAVAEDGINALEIIQSDPPDVVLLDIWLPGMDGIEVLKSVKMYQPEVEVLIMSGHGTIDTAVQATKLGAYDFIEKPFSLDKVTQSVSSVFRQKKARLNHCEGVEERELPLCFELIGDIRTFIHQTAGKKEPVMLIGEKGTGKEFVAHIIHRLSPLADCSFIKLNCALRKPEEIRFHLFPGTDESFPKAGGRFISPEKGAEVVYLTHVEALSTDIQRDLAKALKNAAENEENADLLPARLIASSYNDLSALTESGFFLPELLERFSAPRVIPPLRDHADKIPLLVEDYFREYGLRNEVPVPELDGDGMTALTNHHWPGNLKELRSVLDRLLMQTASKGRIALGDLPQEFRNSAIESTSNPFEGFESLKEAELNWEKGFLIHHLRKNQWNLERTAQSLRTPKEVFREKLHLHGIDASGADDAASARPFRLQRTLKRSVVLCGSGLHSGIKTGLILRPLPPNSGIIFGDISSGQTIPARLDNVESTDYSTCLKKGSASVATIEHIMAVLHMYRITNLLIKIGDEAPVMDGSARDFCDLIEDGEFEEQDGMCEEIVIDRTYLYGSPEKNQPHITIEPSDKFRVTYHMEYPEPIGIEEYTYEFNGEKSFKEEIAPARTFGFLEDVAQLTKMGFATGGKLDNFILLGDKKVLNTKLRFENEFSRHKILDILGDFYLLGKPLRGHIKAHRTGHRHNVALLAQIRDSLLNAA